jgi:hypothetical protein
MQWSFDHGQGERISEKRHTKNKKIYPDIRGMLMGRQWKMEKALLSKQPVLEEGD